MDLKSIRHVTDISPRLALLTSYRLSFSQTEVFSVFNFLLATEIFIVAFGKVSPG